MKKAGRAETSGGWTLGRTFFLAGALAAGGASCAHKATPPSTPEVKSAVAATRGRCPTDLHDTQVLLTKGPNEVTLVFRTQDPSQTPELGRRVAELGEALANVHPAVNDRGERIQHAALPRPEVREAATADGPERGVELVLRAKETDRAVILADLQDHLALWRRGECPIMADESVRPEEVKDWTRVDR
jgi:hypothetical protein